MSMQVNCSWLCKTEHTMKLESFANFQDICMLIDEAECITRAKTIDEISVKINYILGKG